MKKQKIRISNKFLSYILGCIISTILSVCVIFLGAMWINKEVVSITHIHYISLGIYFISSFVGVLTTGLIIKEKDIRILLYVGVTYILEILCLGLLFGNPKFMDILWLIIAVSVSTLTAIFITARKKTHIKRKGRKVSSR